MQFLNILINILGYSDSAQSNSPYLRDIDYTRQLIGIATENSNAQRVKIPAGNSLEIMSINRTLTQDATTEYSVRFISGNTFRWVFTGGTNPNLKTKRTVPFDALTQYNVTKTGDVVRFTWDGTGTAPDFIANGVVDGDILNIEESSNFNPSNAGQFTIVSVASTYIEVLNENGVAETGIAVGALIDGFYSPFIVFDNDGVQNGDQVKITSSAFNVENRGVFTVSVVTPEYFEINNGNPGIPEGSFAIGDADSVIFYSDIYKFLYIESDQKISVRVNGDTSDRIEIEPIVAGDTNNVGMYLQRGSIWKLILANNGNSIANVKIALFE